MRWKIVVLGTVLAAVPAGVSADHLTAVAVGQRFFQDQPAGPALVDQDRFLFTALAVPDPASSVGMQSVSVIRPGGRETSLRRPDPGGPLVFEESFGKLFDLEQAYPDGLYQFRVWTNLFPRSCTVSVELSGRAFPPPPRVANLEAAQSIAEGSDFTVRWDPWEEGSATNFVQFTVKDESGDSVFETPFLQDPAALSGLATSVTIPARTLLAARRYTGELVWLNSVRQSTGACPAVMAMAAYYSGTEFPMATAGVGSSFTPALQSSLPVDGAIGVPVSSVVAFHFNKPMAPEVAVTWSTNAEALGWTYRWDETAAILYAIASTPLPGSATVHWTLNASTVGPGFQDLSGYRLRLTRGSFATAAAVPLTTDVREVLLMRGGEYRQEQDVPQPLAYHFILVQAELNAPNTVTSGSLGLPNGREVRLDLAEDGLIWEALAEYAFAADLERFLPDGEYTLTLETARDGVRSFALPVDGAALPGAPQLLGLGAMQAVNPTQPFQFTWAPLSQGTGDDHVVVEILNDHGDTVLETGAGGLPRLPGTATSYEIPAQTLYPGRNYEGVVRFIKLLKSDATTYPGVQAYSAAATSTRFPMRTAGEPMRPVLRVLPAPHGAFRVQVTGEPGRAYLVEIAHVLLPGLPQSGFNGSWGRAVAEGGSFELTEYYFLATPHRFYRVREEPP